MKTKKRTKKERTKLRLVAQFDRSQGEVWLTVQDQNSNVIEGLSWPDDWPKSINGKFLAEHGFEVEDI